MAYRKEQTWPTKQYYRKLEVAQHELH